jgi:AcrR family transcriptional regulator
MSDSSYLYSHFSTMPSPRKKQLQPRKRPAQARSAETVAVILAAAAHILERDGYGQYSTNAIAKHAGVSIGSLYQYFPGKDAITIALIQQEGTRVFGAIEKASLIDNWQDALRAMIDVAARHQMARPALARILDVEESRLQPENGTAEIAAILEAVLKRGLSSAMPIGHRTPAIDVVAIVRGVADMAAEQQHPGLDDLRHRLDCAFFGYLALACPGCAELLSAATQTDEAHLRAAQKRPRERVKVSCQRTQRRGRIPKRYP